MVQERHRQCLFHKLTKGAAAPFLFPLACSHLCDNLKAQYKAQDKAQDKAQQRREHATSDKHSGSYQPENS